MDSDASTGAQIPRDAVPPENRPVTCDSLCGAHTSAYAAGSLMSDRDNHDDDPAAQSVGGRAGHIIRRLFHVSMLTIPLAWYWGLDDLEANTGWTRTELAASLVVLIVVLEAIRLWRGITVFGQRAYEARQVSAMAWGTGAIALVLWLAPTQGLAGACFGLPIVWSLSLVDPLLGELRRAGVRAPVVALSGVAATAAIWGVCVPWLETPAWLVAVMPVVTVAAEWPRLKWIDDNATMTLLPLAVVLLTTH
jgi:hypothetical protein